MDKRECSWTKEFEKDGVPWFSYCEEVAVHPVGCKSYCDKHKPKDSTKPTPYTIKPLEWSEDTGKAFAGVGNYRYAVYAMGDTFFWCHGGSDRIPCTSIEDGKAQAWEHYKRELGKCLEVWNG